LSQRRSIRSKQWLWIPGILLFSDPSGQVVVASELSYPPPPGAYQGGTSAPPAPRSTPDLVMRPTADSDATAAAGRGARLPPLPAERPSGQEDGYRATNLFGPVSRPAASSPESQEPASSSTSNRMQPPHFAPLVRRSDQQQDASNPRHPNGAGIYPGYAQRAAPQFPGWPLRVAPVGPTPSHRNFYPPRHGPAYPLAGAGVPIPDYPATPRAARPRHAHSTVPAHEPEQATQPTRDPAQDTGFVITEAPDAPPDWYAPAAPPTAVFRPND